MCQNSFFFITTLLKLEHWGHIYSGHRTVAISYLFSCVDLSHVNPFLLCIIFFLYHQSGVTHHAWAPAWLISKKLFFQICFLLVRYLFVRFFSSLCDTMDAMGYTTLITFVAEYLVDIFINLCLYVKYTYYGCYVFPCSLGFCIVIVVVSLMRIEKNK